jgi:hypothetical protein
VRKGFGLDISAVVGGEVGWVVLGKFGSEGGLPRLVSKVAWVS